MLQDDMGIKQFNGDGEWMSTFSSSYSHNFQIIAGKLLHKTPKQVKTQVTAVWCVATALLMSVCEQL